MFPIPLTQRQRKKEYDRAAGRDSPKPRDKERDRLRTPRKSSGTKKKDSDGDYDQGYGSSSSSSSSTPRAKRKVTMAVPEMDRRKHSSSALNSKSNSPSLPYPSFSKAHSREAVHSLENGKTSDPFTPDPTDLSKTRPHTTPPKTTYHTNENTRAPPSPPMTAVQSDLKRATSGSSMRKAAEKAKGHTRARRRSADGTSPYQGKPGFSASRSSLRQAEEGSKGTQRSSPLANPSSSTHLRSNSANSAVKKPGGEASPTRKRAARNQTSKRHSLTDSDATSVAPERKQSRRPPTLVSNDGDSPPSDNESPKTPELHATPTAPPPPPPPPPEVAVASAPRVDYLLQYGGLPNAVPKEFTSARNPQTPLPYNQYMSPQAQPPRSVDVQSTFAPYHDLLDEFSKVLSRNGSVAVATGYRSVARRLLDRLEAVFARNISSEKCDCVMCRSNSPYPNGLDEETDGGVSWGEVLELVSGRRELPPWPPFSLPNAGMSGLGIKNLEQQAAPMQKMDVDVPDEYRDHYVRQSKKTKDAVQKWLASQPTVEPQPSAPPAEVDDETLTFAMLTYLEPVQRRTFTALDRGLSSVPESRAPTPLHTDPERKQSKTDLMNRTGQAIQRLYRLPQRPRDPECSMYLLKNPSLHSALATLAAISHQEWEILISGRFDGFLWSGADGNMPIDALSKTQTGSYIPGLPRTNPPSGATTPAPGSIPGGPVAVDEETEIAVLAEVEREIYVGMEALEDAFEALHLKAENIRNALAERGAGLAMGAQNRRAANNADAGVEVRLGTPAGANGLSNAGTEDEAEQDLSALDGWSELAPDDSASNVGHKERSSGKEARRRYKKRRDRRTPAPVDEESGDGG